MINLNGLELKLTMEGTTYSLLVELSRHHMMIKEESDRLEKDGIKEENFEKELHKILKGSNIYNCYKLYEIETTDAIARIFKWKSYRIEFYSKRKED